MIKTILIDDEPDSLEALNEDLIKYCPDLSILATYGNPIEGLTGIKNLKPDLVFLDIQMPGMSGFDLLQKAAPVTFEVIFVSAHEKYAIRAIKFSALDYLLKPVDADELTQTVALVKDRLSQKYNEYPLLSILNNVQHQKGKIERIAVPSAKGMDFFELKEVIFCAADGCYTTIFLTQGRKEVVSRTLGDFEQLLSESGFCRVHHSSLINLRHVQHYIKGEGGYVILTEDHHVDISRRKKEEFLTMLDLL